MVVSIAFLGYGASGSLLSLFKKLASYDLDKFLSSSSFLFSLTIPICFLLCNSIPFDFIRISWDKNQIFFIFLYYVLLCLPFFFAGLTISFAITKASKLVNKIYFFDLLGAGSGTLIAACVFLLKGDRGVIISISFLALFSSFFFSIRRSISFKILLASLLVIEASVFITSPSWLGFRISPFKALPVAMKYPGADHRFTRWNAISRIDILESPAVRYAPGLSLMYRESLPLQLGLSIDGGELTAITHFKNLQEPALGFLRSLPSSLAYSLVKHPRTLIIEPKGGLDVLAAYAFGASKIKVIESNPLIVKILRNELRSFSGSLYFKENIQFGLSHNRAALKQEKDTYDLIIFSLTDVFGASGTGMYGFGENYLYTVDSFADILDRMSPAGLVSMTMYLLPPPRQELRLLATWIEALEQSKIDPSSSLLAIRSWGTISYFIKKSPFSQEDIQRLKNFAEERLFDLVYYPGIKTEEVNIHNRFDEPLYHNYTLQLLSSLKRKELYKNYLFQISPVTDDRPFFFNFFKLDKIKTTYNSLGKKWLPLLQGEFLILLLLMQSFIIAFVLIFLPLIVFRKTRNRGRGVFLKVFFYFSLIGMAFMFVEITLIQKFILFLGHPLYSISIIIFSLLFSSGLGSYFSKKILGQDLRKNLKGCLLLCAGLIALYLFLLPILQGWLIGLTLLFKIILAFFIIFPLGFLMGFPFPSGIRLLESHEKMLIPWAWATNAFSSVINSISALMIAFWGGYNLVLILATGGYLLALLFLGFAGHGNKTDT
ncbi:MAG: hypothetical protein JSV96_15255 [Candidatus Aminicenantes bacterium]|nr:MAG: hypothetical protein JSV96_15255 [Candidatus Aminicenantes bacterium]